STYVGVGYPDKWRDYSGLMVDANDAFGNNERAQEFEYQRALAKFGKAVDETEWCMNPQLVNAVNMPLQNAINFPAAYLQAPNFSLTASLATNYGALGATIGHEISHSFDNSGAMFDAKGELRNWWTKADFEHFERSSKALIEQFNAYKPFPDLAVNGAQTLGENIADLAGLMAAYDAYHNAMQHKGLPVTKKDDQEFFLAYAQSWRGKMRDEYLRTIVVTNEHAPGKYRVLTVRNLDAWYDAFDVKADQKQYLAPTSRVKIW
ncbi:MAG: M13 family metallopeptidase, partial [Burkholderiales bacterium]|nr:M13 family metallopeptidase [Burkholderiales bacterium]